MTTPTMAEQLVPDELWDAIQPLLPPKRPHPKGGRPWIQDRAVLGGIIYVLRAGVPWRLLPAKELGCGSGVTCWRRLRDWQAAGVWEALHYQLLDWLGDDGQVDWSRAAIDSVSVRARRAGTSLARIRSIARVMTSRPAGGRCAAVGSARGSPGVGWSPARGWAATVGRWSGRWPGSWPTGG